MADLFEIQDWEAKPWFSTGGTRAKKYVEGKDGKLYYFKRSEYKEAQGGKPEKDYRYEFWSEVIAHEVGTLLGFNTLRYDIAIDNDIVGCLCEDMLGSGKEELIMGVQYLQGYDNFFDPLKREHRKKYTFQLIENAMAKYGYEVFLKNITSLIVFDTIIGNSDRHQENWGVIAELKPLYRSMEKVLNSGDEEERQLLRDAKLLLPDNMKFAPFFDNGSSLCRELSACRVEELLLDKDLQEIYIQKGKAEIHWQEQKLSHFQLVENLLDSNYRKEVIESIMQVRERFDEKAVNEIVYLVDNVLPSSHSFYKMPDVRKELIAKIITLRSQKLFTLLK